MSLAAADAVDSSSRGGRTRDVWFPWTFRRILGLPGSPLAIGAGAVLLSLAVSAAWFKRAGHAQQLGGESPLHNLMEVKC